MDGWMGGWMEGWMDGGRDGWVNECMNKYMNGHMGERTLTSGSWKGAVHPSCDSPNNSRSFALGASNACLAGENPTCSVPAW